ncbi:MAG: FecR family protein [Sphingomonas bacterium]|uniref:FecR family protein n=1 Tax=Sphingomonas bacterium TaxID=1895847 RepID=UPI002604350A|nr:FecR domain-containing protein [Sphingomonas bacterium]MDB5708954.1 FecR family protein [Sphingomonas bacterium]
MAQALRRGIGGAFIVTMAGLSLGGVAIGADSANTVGINAVVYNNVRLKSAGAAQAHVAVVRERVGLGDEVQTGGRSQLQVLLLDKTTFTVGAGARVTIDRFVYDPGRGTRSMAASVVKGAFRFMSGRPDRAGTTSIRTPVASIGIRGTIVEGVVGPAAAEIASGESAVGPRVRIDPATASLILLRGPGPRTQGRLSPGAIDVTAGGRTVSVTQPMRAVFVPAPGMAPIGPFVISARGYAGMRALLFPLLAQRLGLNIPGERPFTPYGNGQRDDRPPLPPPGYGYPGGERPGQGPRSPQYGAPGFPGSGQGFPDFPREPQGTQGTQGQRTMSTTTQPAGQPAAAPSPAPSPSPTYSPQPSPTSTPPPGKVPGKP